MLEKIREWLAMLNPYRRQQVILLEELQRHCVAHHQHQAAAQYAQMIRRVKRGGEL